MNRGGSNKMTIRKLSKWLFWFCILLDLHFLYLFAYPSFANTLFHRRIMTGSLALVALIMNCYAYRGVINSQYRFLKRYCIFVLSIFILLFAYTCIKYPMQPLKTTYLSSNNIMVMMWALPIVIFLKDIEGFHVFARKINWILLIWLVLVMLQGILYNASGILMLDFKSYFVGDVATRNNQLRMTIGGLANVMILYDFDVWFTKKVKKTGLPFIVFCIGIIDALFVQQTRVYIISIAAGMAITLLVGSKGKKNKIRNIVILLFVVVILIFSNSISNLLASFSVNSELGGSTENRLREIYYYWNYFWQHPLIGMGGLSDAVESAYKNIVHGALGWFYLDDIGYIGMLANGGFLVSSILFIFLGRSIKIIKMFVKKHLVTKYSYFISIIIFVVISDITLAHFLTQKVNLILPIILALGELIYAYEGNSPK